MKPAERTRAGGCTLLLVIVIVSAGLTGCGCEQLEVTATAFNSTRAQTDGNPFDTACGVKLQPGERVIAVSPDLAEQGLVCGTELRIDGMEGTWTVADVTSARHQRLIDIYMGRDVQGARQWGRREVAIRWCK